MDIIIKSNRLSTFKWFTDNYTIGTWGSGVNNIFDISRSNVSATSNKAINYSDLLNPNNYDNEDLITNKCLREIDFDFGNLMRETSFEVDIIFDNSTGGTILYFTNTYFDSNPEVISSDYPIKLEVTINNSNPISVNVDYQGDGGKDFEMLINEPIESIKINKVSVYRPNKTSPYIIKPQITFNYATGLPKVTFDSQAAKFATLGSEINNYKPGGVDDGGGGNTEIEGGII